MPYVSSTTRTAEPESTRVRTADTQSKSLISNPRASDFRGTPPKTVKLENSVVNRHAVELDCLWEKIGDKLSEVEHLLRPELRSQFANYSRCGQENVYRVCRGCGNYETLAYQCSIKWCPRCVWKLTKRRQDELAHWTEAIKQPKHVVLTQTNSAILSRSDLARNAKNIRALTRQVVFRHVNGGCVSTELTNKSRGWHLHTHWLVDARWIDARELAIAWGKLVGQRFGIVKVKDARAQDYRREVAKYVVKSTELASWTPRQIAQFIEAIYRSRLFVRFGTLRTMEKPQHKHEQRVCACGCCEFVHENEVVSIIKQHRKRS